jgi:hypothetical protein
MPLFRDENPALGASTSVKELSGYGAGNPTVNYFKPTTREVIDVQLIANAGSAGMWVYQAPWACQVVGAHINWTAQSTGASNLSIEKITADALAPAAANGTTIVLLTNAVVSLQGTANTRQNLTLSSASGSPLVLNPGDQIALFWSAATTGLAGCNVQIELAQIG